MMDVVNVFSLFEGVLPPQSEDQAICGYQYLQQRYRTFQQKWKVN